MPSGLSAIVIGCGRIGGGITLNGFVDEPSHAAAYTEHRGFHITACVDPDTARRERFMARWKVHKGFPSIGAANAAGVHCDVASICSPTKQHASDLRALLSSRVRAVWCEKPLTGSAAETAELTENYRKAGVALAVNYLRRWHPSIAVMRSKIAGGELGEIRAVVGFYTKGIRNNGSHLIDLIHYLFGKLDTRFAMISRVDYDPLDPALDAVLQLEDGTPVHLICGHAEDYALFELEIIASRGSIRFERSGRALRKRQPVDDPNARGYRILSDGNFEEVGTGEVFRHAAENIYRAVTEGVPLVSDGATALAVERVCDELIERAQRP